MSNPLPGHPRPYDFTADILNIASIETLPGLLDAVCGMTGVGFAAVARVADERWVACVVHDEMDLGVQPGDELEFARLIADTAGDPTDAVVIDRITEDKASRSHAMAARYGVQCYISVPIVLPNGSVWGVLCALGSQPAALNTPAVVGMCKGFAELVAFRLDAISLRDSEARMGAIFATASVGLSEVDTNGRFLRVNKELCRLLGRPEHELLRLGVPDVTYPDDLPPSLVAVQQAIETGASTALDKRYRHPDGKLVWANSSIQRLDDAAGELQTLIVVTVDLSRRIETEEALRASEEFNRSVLASSADCIMVHDLDAGLEFISEGGMRAAEVDDFSTLKGARWPDLWLGHQRATVLAAVEEAKQGRTGRFQGFAPTMKGTPRWWDVIVTPITGSDGMPEKLLSISRDVTVNKEAEVHLRELNETLEERVVERTADLLNAQAALRQAQKMEAVGQLTGGLAHDFNNLLAGISGSLELMRVRMGQGRFNELERYINAAHVAATRAAALTHRLLAFSRRQTLDPKPTNINRLVGGMEEMIRRTVGPSIEVSVVGAPDLWLALVDPPQLENALLNLAINARDAMPQGGRLTIETGNRFLDQAAAQAQDLSEGQYLTLCVTDTGIGMTPQLIERVFEPFFTTKPIGEGTGLGLSMIYGFVQQTGGQIRINSEVGQGTTVCIYLPRHDGVEYTRVDTRTSEQVAHTAQGETVLVVDDEPVVRMLVIDILEELGYKALEAADSLAGLKILRSDARIDLLVTDVGLPGGMNGRQMADAGLQIRPELKVLFITGYAEQAALGDGQLRPGMAVLTKPFAVETMAARIREMLV
jgi:PAS domain S-box-containing protein